MRHYTLKKVFYLPNLFNYIPKPEGKRQNFYTHLIETLYDVGHVYPRGTILINLVE